MSRDVVTAFTVVVETDGTVSLVLDSSPLGLDCERAPSLVDIEAYGSQISREAGRMLLARGMANPTVAETVSKALKRRKKP